MKIIAIKAHIGPKISERDTEGNKAMLEEPAFWNKMPLGKK